VGEVVAVAQLAHVKTIWSEERRRVQLGLCLISFVEFLRFALVKEFFYCQVIPDRHSAKKFFFIFKKYCVDYHLYRHSTKYSLLSVPGTLRKFYLHFFFLSPTFLWCVLTIFGPTCLILAQLSKCLLYLLYLIHSIEFLWVIKI
jgi:hypothetical protein